jgi:hypothetical protein
VTGGSGVRGGYVTGGSGVRGASYVSASNVKPSYETATYYWSSIAYNTNLLKYGLFGTIKNKRLFIFLSQ